MDESWLDGKQVDARDRFRPVLNTGFAQCLIGTAVYGPVSTVVWDPWLALAVSHGDPIGIVYLVSMSLTTTSTPPNHFARRL